MLFEELHRRYGNHVSQRVQRELSQAEFGRVRVEDLVEWLEDRAEVAHADYRNMLNNPLAASESDAMQAGAACQRWRDAEDLAYLVAIAEDVGVNARVS